MTTPLMTPEEFLNVYGEILPKGFASYAAAYAKELIALRVLAGRMVEAIDKYWSFDDNQQHTHSWHTKQDCLELLRNELRGDGLLPPESNPAKGESQ